MTAIDLHHQFMQLPQTEKEHFMTLLVKPDYITYEELVEPMLSDLVSSSEAAELLDISMPTFRRWVRSGRINPTKTIGRSQMFLFGDVLKLIRAHAV